MGKKGMRFFVISLVFLLPITIAGKAGNGTGISFMRDGLVLKGQFFPASGTGPFPTVLLLQGFPGNKKDVLGIGKKLSEAGINAMTFNYSGTHQSQGKFNIDNSQKDIRAALAFIHQKDIVQKFKIDTSHTILGGYSYGGGMALSYGVTHPEITRIISIAGNDHGTFIEAYRQNPEMKKSVDEMFSGFLIHPANIRFDKGGTPKDLDRMKIIEANPAYHVKHSAASLANRDILLIGGWNDRGVSIENIILPVYRALQNEGAEKLKIVAFQDDHQFKVCRNKIAKTVIQWIRGPQNPEPRQ